MVQNREVEGENATCCPLYPQATFQLSIKVGRIDSRYLVPKGVTAIWRGCDPELGNHGWHEVLADPYCFEAFFSRQGCLAVLSGDGGELR